MNILMISQSVYETDVRVRREAEALVSAGHRLTILCLGESSNPMPGLRVEGIDGITGLTGRRPRSSSLPYRMARWLLLPSHRQRALRQFERSALERIDDLAETPDAVHAHDYPALGAAAQTAAATGSRLVYDSHEFWPGIRRPGRPAPIGLRSETRRERRLANRADAVITVSDGAAALLESRTGLSNISVVHNSFPTRTDLAPSSRPTGAAYAGRIGGGRDLETVLAADTWGGNLEFHVIGPTDGTVRLPEWVVVHEPANMDTVDRLLVRTGIALVPLADGPLNHRIALPNKLFQAVAVGVPVVAADLPDIRRLVTAHRLGTLYRPGDPSSLSRAVREVVSKYDSYLTSVRKAAPLTDWNRDSETLLGVYDSLSR